MRRIDAVVSVANPCHTNHRKHATLSVLIVATGTKAFALHMQVFHLLALITMRIQALSVAPNNPSMSPSHIEDDRQHGYDRPNLQRRDILASTARFTTVAVSVLIGSSSIPTICYGLSPTEAQQQYDSYASSYDQIDGGIASELLRIDIARKLLIQQAQGKVLEVGVGTGLNLPYYNADQVTSLDVVDISNGMLQVARNKVVALPNLRNIPINFIRADMTSQLEQKFGLESYDTIVDTFSMCVLGDEGARQCLDQMRRVVRRNGGQILLLENSRSTNPFLGGYQDATAETAATVGGRGCKYNQNIRNLIQSNDRLQIIDETEFAAGLFRSFSLRAKR